MAENSLTQSHEPQLLHQLRQRTLALQSSLQSLSSHTKTLTQTQSTLSSELQALRSQTEVQQKKHRSLIVLLNELQQSYHSQYLEIKQQGEGEGDQVGLGLENGLLRFLLVRRAEELREGEKVLGFVKMVMLDRNRGKAKEYIKKSNFIESQSELIAKLKSQIHTLKNSNLECKRKWYTLHSQTQTLSSSQTLLEIQTSRQKLHLKSLYQSYLERINEAKTKVVSFNETQKQSIITEYFVKEIAVLQQERVQVEEEGMGLGFHLEGLESELGRIQGENRELWGFFRGGEEGGLAEKMRKRIEELRDVVLECKKKNKNTRGAKLRKTLQLLKSQHSQLAQSNSYIELKTREQQNYGSILEQKPIADFFSKVLEQKDKAITLMASQEEALRENLKELEMQRELLRNQICGLEDNLGVQGAGWERGWGMAMGVESREGREGRGKAGGTQGSEEFGYGYRQDGSFTFERRP